MNPRPFQLAAINAARASVVGGKVPRTCSVCGTAFEAHRCVVRAGWAKTCSWACRRRRHEPAHRDLFWGKVYRTAQCWFWLGTTNGRGYGTARRGGRSVYAHRYSWALHRGPVPRGRLVLHVCDVRNCVNPDHLFLGSARENTRDMVHKGRDDFYGHHARRGL